MTVMVGTPRVEMHYEAHTEDCICDRTAWCGAIESVNVNCVEHSGPRVVSVPFHTHAQQVDRINRGRYVV